MTGLIYVILIAIWGVVLVPRWLRHHDESKRRREQERLEAALAPVPDPESDAGRSGSWGEYLRSLTHVDATWLHHMRRPDGRHARRRRTITLGLATLFTIGLIGSVLGLVPGFVTVLAGVLLAGYLSAMFLKMRQWEAVRHMDQQHLSRARQAQDSAGTAPIGTVADGVRVMPNGRASGSEWEPRETTLPTYVSKPKASKIPRRIDLTRAGWTGADMVQQARQQQSIPSLQQQFDREFAAIEPDDEIEAAAYAQSDDSYYGRAVNE